MDSKSQKGVVTLVASLDQKKITGIAIAADGPIKTKGIFIKATFRGVA